MDHRIASDGRVTHRRLASAGFTALALGLTLSLAQSAQAGRITPPPVPSEIEVDAGSKPFFVGHAVGTQNYVCAPSVTGDAIVWTLFTPQATLFDGDDKQLTTHFFSPNPFEDGKVRPTWQHSRDTSSVWVKLNTPSTDPAFVAPGAVAWLLLDVVGAAAGPNGGGALTAATQIHRVDTVGGLAPSTGCSTWEDVGHTEFVPYEADYYFYAKPAGDEDEDE